MNTITVNGMMRNEPFGVYALASIINYVDHAIITDTGSDDGTYEELQELQQDYPDKIELRQEQVENSHNWSIENTQVKSGGISEKASKQLGDIRRQMHEDSKDYTYVWLLDGDELYSDYLGNKICQLCSNESYKQDVFIPTFIDVIDNLTLVRDIHTMCRIFRQETSEIRGDFPAEMHYQKYTNVMYESGCPNSITIQPEWLDAIDNVQYYVIRPDSCVLHLESIIKPWRKERKVISRIYPYVPEVINEKMLDKFPRIKKYVEL